MRQFLAASIISMGLVAIPTAAISAADPTPAFGFSTLKAVSPQAAKAKSEAWLKSVGKFNQAEFDKVWGDESRTVLDRTADSLALGNTEAAAILTNIRKSDAVVEAKREGSKP